MSAPEHVVLLDGVGRAVDTTPKAIAHGRGTPLHLAFSCHVVDDVGRVLLTRRAPTKPTWPGVWTNACCGHPQLGETLRGAVERRLREELGLVVERIGRGACPTSPTERPWTTARSSTSDARSSSPR